MKASANELERLLNKRIAETLAGFPAPSPPRGRPSDGVERAARHFEEVWVIALTENVNVTTAARRFAERARLTLNHVLKAVADIDRGNQCLLAEIGERIEWRAAEN